MVGLRGYSSGGLGLGSSAVLFKPVCAKCYHLVSSCFEYLLLCFLVDCQENMISALSLSIVKLSSWNKEGRPWVVSSDRIYIHLPICRIFTFLFKDPGPLRSQNVSADFTAHQTMTQRWSRCGAYRYCYSISAGKNSIEFITQKATRSYKFTVQ